MKRFDFFKALDQFCSYTKREAVILKKQVYNRNNRSAFETESERIFQETQTLLKTVTSQLYRAFITPIDAADLYDLALVLTKTIEKMNFVVHLQYDVDQTVLSMTDLIEKNCMDFSNACKSIQNPQPVFYDFDDSVYLYALNALYGYGASVHVLQSLTVCTQLHEILQLCRTFFEKTERIKLKNR